MDVLVKESHMHLIICWLGPASNFLGLLVGVKFEPIYTQILRTSKFMFGPGLVYINLIGFQVNRVGKKR